MLSPLRAVPCTGTAAYQCQACHEGYEAPQDLSAHLKQFPDHCQFVCGMCSDRFATVQGLRSHMRLAHNTTLSKKHKALGGLKRSAFGDHQYLHAEHRAFKCGACEATFPSRSSCESHMRVHLKGKTSRKKKKPAPKGSAWHGTLPTKCRYCPKRFATNDELQQHRLTEHLGAYKYACGYEECGEHFLNAEEQIKHREDVHGLMSERPFHCRLCGETFRSSGQLHYHRHTRHVVATPQTCDACGATFQSTLKLKAHIANRHRSQERKVYKCGLCGRQLTSLVRLDKHMLIHTGVRPYTCQICGRGFKESMTLREHTYTHTREKPYECHVCHTHFRSSAGLCHHRRDAHSGVPRATKPRASKGSEEPSDDIDQLDMVIVLQEERATSDGVSSSNADVQTAEPLKPEMPEDVKRILTSFLNVMEDD